MGSTLPLDYVCHRCGNAAVARDAWVQWSVPEQAWTLSAVFDFAFCQHCHRETRIIAQPVDGGAEGAGEGGTARMKDLRGIPGDGADRRHCRDVKS